MKRLSAGGSLFYGLWEVCIGRIEHKKRSHLYISGQGGVIEKASRFWEGLKVLRMPQKLSVTCDFFKSKEDYFM